MFLPRILLAAAVAAPLAFSQAPGLGRAQADTVRADVAGAGTSDEPRSAGKSDELPPGIERVFAGRDLPTGVRRRTGEPEPEPLPLPEPEPEPVPLPEPEPEEPCTTIAIVNGFPTVVPC